MQTGIRLVAQYYDVATGKTLGESILGDAALSKAATLKELGYLHVEQIDFLKKIQDFKIKHQIVLSSVTTCPLCNSPTKKAGSFKSKFHAALTDHDVAVQRTGWFSASSVEGIYGSAIHPDLLAKQALQGSKESQACRYLVINSGTSKSPEFTRQRDRYACGALAAQRPFIFKSPTGLKNNTTTMADAFSDALYFSCCGKTFGLRLPGKSLLVINVNFKPRHE